LGSSRDGCRIIYGGFDYDENSSGTKNISMLVIKNNASFSKKAKGVITFSCTQGNLVDQALQNTIATGEGQTLILTANGIDSSGDEVSSFDFEWSLKLKQKKIKR
jgi:hypothetical protein